MIRGLIAPNRIAKMEAGHFRSVFFRSLQLYSTYPTKSIVSSSVKICLGFGANQWQAWQGSGHHFSRLLSDAMAPAHTRVIFPDQLCVPRGKPDSPCVIFFWQYPTGRLPQTVVLHRPLCSPKGYSTAPSSPSQSSSFLMPSAHVETAPHLPVVLAGAAPFPLHPSCRFTQ